MSLPGTARRALVLPTENVKALPHANDLEDALQANSFDATPLTNAATKTRQGWCLPDNFLDCDFHVDLDRWNHGDFLRFQHRLEEPAVNQKLVAAHLDRQVRDWCREHGRPRCPRAVKDDMRERIEETLAARTDLLGDLARRQPRPECRGSPLPPETGVIQIGRASCRERV